MNLKIEIVNFKILLIETTAAMVMGGFPFARGDNQ